MVKKTKQGNEPLAKNVKQFMAMLPSDYLRSLSNRELQAAYWSALREDAQLLGECLSSRFTRRGGNPARRYLKEKKITELRYERINDQVDMWDLFYDLLQLSWDDMKQVNSVAPQEFPFELEQELFFSVLSHEYNARFAECLQQHYKYSPATVEKAGKMIRAAFWQNKGPTPEQQQNVDRLIGRTENFWFFYAMQFFHSLSNTDPVVARKLENFKKFVANSTDSIIKNTTKERKSGEGLTYAWHNGQLLIFGSGSKIVNRY